MPAPRQQDIQRRLRSAAGQTRRCAIVDCDQPTTASRGKGLNLRFCRRHEDHHERHGSYLKASYSAIQVAPLKAKALRWLKDHQSDRQVVLAARRMETLMLQAGTPVDAFRMRGLSPTDRARAVWAKLRESERTPIQILAVWLAVNFAIESDPQPDWRQEFRFVQLGKAIHRMAGGTHRRWERETANGRTQVTELHRYPASRGQILRHLGRQLNRAAETLADIQQNNP